MHHKGRQLWLICRMDSQQLLTCASIAAVILAVVQQDMQHSASHAVQDIDPQWDYAAGQASLWGLRPAVAPFMNGCLMGGSLTSAQVCRQLMICHCRQPDG